MKVGWQCTHSSLHSLMHHEFCILVFRSFVWFCDFVLFYELFILHYEVRKQVVATASIKSRKQRKIPLRLYSSSRFIVSSWFMHVFLAIIFHLFVTFFATLFVAEWTAKGFCCFAGWVLLLITEWKYADLFNPIALKDGIKKKSLRVTHDNKWPSASRSLRNVFPFFRAFCALSILELVLKLIKTKRVREEKLFGWKSIKSGTKKFVNKAFGRRLFSRLNDPSLRGPRNSPPGRRILTTRKTFSRFPLYLHFLNSPMTWNYQPKSIWRNWCRYSSNCAHRATCHAPIHFTSHHSARHLFAAAVARRR